MARGNNVYRSLACFCVLLLTGIAQGLQVDDELLIEVVENGTVDAVEFDCPYTIEEEDLGLAVKWFFRDNPVPLYQWIAGHGPSHLGLFSDRIDLAYESSDDPDHKHSGLRLLNPTTDMSGDYRCQASTFDVELEIPRKLVVYSKPSNVEIWTKEEGEDSVRVFCKVRDIYPEPEVTFHMMSEDENDRAKLEGVDVVKSWDDNLYHAMVEVLVKEEELDGPTHFECEVTIPHTEVFVTNKTHYEPMISGSEAHSAMAVVVSLAFLAIWRF
ncbi:uncharacterized protein LOC135201442 isoform X3 [Macrobrachium nipponense]|uniref:uncharacterized protein LOC135201442 isoform X3 n=1 Tax=Macrobrachium nipponense TaxID=159736 RepID=UPI0030C7DE2F